MAETVRVERDGGVACLTVSRPEVKNALDLATIEILSHVVDTLARDAALRAVVLTGAGRMFISGGDVKDVLIGLVDEVVPAGEARGAALRLAARIAAQPAASVRATNRALHHGAELSRAEAAAFEAECFAGLWTGPAHRRALGAFLGPRPAEAKEEEERP